MRSQRLFPVLQTWVTTGVWDLFPRLAGKVGYLLLLRMSKHNTVSKATTPLFMLVSNRIDGV
jgi:hypothetical protein